MKKKIGIVGGMGPMATVELFRLIVQHTSSSNDQGHIRILIDNNPQIPDRTEAILTGSKQPITEIQKSAMGLVQAGADFILIPCNTSHYFFDELQSLVSVDIVNMIDETAREAKRFNLHKVGLLATSGTVKTRIYHKYFENQGIEVLQPDEKGQREVMSLIYDGVKAMNDGYDTAGFLSAVEDLFDKGAETIVLGCTEIPIGVKIYGMSFPYLDSMEVLAKRAIVKAGYIYK